MSYDEQKPAIPPTRTNKELELLRETGKHLDKFLCQGDQRTDLENSEVPIISILDRWTSNPYPISLKIAQNRGMNISGIEKDENGGMVLYKPLLFLSGFLSNYKKFRISRARKGRTEDKEVMMSYMNMMEQALRDNERNGSSKLLK